jgi:hypothetical protein
VFSAPYITSVVSEADSIGKLAVRINKNHILKETPLLTRLIRVPT